MARTPTVETDDDEKPRRIDAVRNRERILQTAFEVLGDMGVDAQMTDIAEAAGLGIGTLYRNFPSKEALVNALVAERLSGAAVSAKKAAENPDAWEALSALIYLITKRQMENRVLSQFLGGRIAGSPELLEQRDVFYGMLEKVVNRAKRAGQMRKDVNIADVRLIMTSVVHISASDSPLAHRLVQRYVGIVLDGLRGPGTSKLPGPPLTLEQSEEAFRYPSAGRAMRRGRRTWPS